MRPAGARRVGAPLLAAIGLACAAGACVQPKTAPSMPTVLESKRPIDFYGHPLVVHLARRVEPPPGRPLLLFATGDGGWRGVAVDAYRQMAEWGYPVAGFSAKDYLKHLGFVSGTTTPERLALDYRRLIIFARAALNLPGDARTVLVGISRGAGLAVVAAGRPELRSELGGVLAVALTKEEEYVRHYKAKPGKTPADMPSRELVVFDTYASLEELQSLPLAVIQSTSDSYLNAQEARDRFGPDTDTRKLYAIQARNHNFGGGREALFARMTSALAWMASVSAASSAATLAPTRCR
jgi:hypothetical protein